ncbi:MAG: LD-carboxypeptidase [Acidobacteriota bacterium]|nr:LD-carboxypeptidase [Acidobacteriota bacterium]MDE3139491.1 LD-carboxypeptidase [Acidobacteriota bacterium]
MSTRPPSDDRATSTRLLRTPPKLVPGDKVAIVSPSWAGAGVFPEVHEMGLRVLREELGLVPVELPATRRVGATAEERARDINAAFADPDLKALMAVVGGSDQITVLPHLDADVMTAHPKAFFGYSDNTNLLNFLWRLGIVGYHGGSTLVHLARPGGVHPVHLDSLRHALFDHDVVELRPLHEFTDLQCDWRDLATLERPLPTTLEEGWHWHRADRVVTGPTWGGNLEILHMNLAANRWILPNESYAGCVLLLETSEEMPSADVVSRMLRDAGERGLLGQFSAVVVAKAKAWHDHAPLSESERTAFRTAQEEAILRVLDTYNPAALVVYGPDFGHTDPQWVLPYGGLMTIDGPARRITVAY